MKTKIDTINVDNMGFAVYFEEDDDYSPPWKRHNNDCIVSEYTSRKKAPGEMILHNDGRSYSRYYDYKEACKIALKEGWNYEGSTGTKHEIAANAAMKYCEYLRQWCNKEWRYVGVIVELLDDDGDETGIYESVFGVEDTAWKEAAKELAREIIAKCQRMN